MQSEWRERDELVVVHERWKLQLASFFLSRGVLLLLLLFTRKEEEGGVANNKKMLDVSFTHWLLSR